MNMRCILNERLRLEPTRHLVQVLISLRLHFFLIAVAASDIGYMFIEPTIASMSISELPTAVASSPLMAKSSRRPDPPLSKIILHLVGISIQNYCRRYGRWRWRWFHRSLRPSIRFESPENGSHCSYNGDCSIWGHVHRSVRRKLYWPPHVPWSHHPHPIPIFLHERL